MTYVEQAIKEAVDYGYEPKVERYPEMKGISSLQIAVAMQADVFIDPAFWKALGKKRGWTTDDDFKYWQKSVAEWEERYWKKFWHRFIDHLAEEKDAESFFKELDLASPGKVGQSSLKRTFCIRLPLPWQEELMARPPRVDLSKQSARSRFGVGPPVRRKGGLFCGRRRRHSCSRSTE